KSATASWSQFWATVTSPRVVASYRVTFGASLAGALINMVFGMLVAWVLVRYSLPGRRLVDALVDLPFALPTAVAGLALTAVYAGGGLNGRPPGPARDPGRLLAARDRHRAHVHRPAVRGANGAAGPAEHRGGARGGRGEPRREPLADVAPRHLPDRPARDPDRVRAGLRTCARRVWLGHPHRRQHADADGDHAALDRHQARAIRLRGRDRHRRGDAGRVVRPAALDQRAPVVEPALPGRVRTMARPTTARPGPAREPAVVRVALI